MCLRIPGKSRHPVAEFNAEFGESSGNALCACFQLRIGNAIGLAVFTRGYNLYVRMPFCGVVEKFVERQRLRLHGAV